VIGRATGDSIKGVMSRTPRLHARDATLGTRAGTMSVSTVSPLVVVV
jgi:hypothetical protein